MYVGNGGDLRVDPLRAVAENVADQTAHATVANLKAAGISYTFIDDGNGSTRAPGCTGKHAQEPCVQADMDHFIPLIMQRLQHP